MYHYRVLYGLSTSIIYKEILQANPQHRQDVENHRMIGEGPPQKAGRVYPKNGRVRQKAGFSGLGFVPRVSPADLVLERSGAKGGETPPS